eukprot:1189732-Prorocentrum_minimum.AAC.5
MENFRILYTSSCTRLSSHWNLRSGQSGRWLAAAATMMPSSSRLRFSLTSRISAMMPLELVDFLSICLK